MEKNDDKMNEINIERIKNKINMLHCVKVKNVCLTAIKIIFGQIELLGQLFSSIIYPKIQTKSQMCGKIMHRNDIGFRCQNCIYEDNSIYCQQCFENSDHIGHNFSKILVYGGCCDCGDDQKLKAESFCSKHKKQQLNYELDKKQLEQFTDQTGRIIDFFIQCYQRISQQKQRQRLDLCGEAFVKLLLDFNEGSQISCKMTVSLLQSNSYRPFYSKQTNEKSRLYGLYSLTKLKKMPQLINELSIVLFQVQHFRKKLTIMFCEIYDNNEFHFSAFRALQCQLLTSHKTILQMIQNKQMKPLTLTITETNVEKISELLSSYYQDLFYLLKLHSPSNTEYVLYHLANTNINSLFAYRTLTFQLPQLNNHYGIQKLFLQITSIFCRKIYDRLSYDACKKPLFELANFIFYQKNNDSLHTQYFSQERAFALFTFTYFGLNIDRLDKQEQMISFLNIIGLKKGNLFQLIEKVFDATLQKYALRALILDDHRTIQTKYTYFVITFQRENFLTSLDNIFLQILLKISRFIGYNYNVFDNKVFHKMIEMFQIQKTSLPEFPVPDDLYNMRKISRKICNFIALVLQALTFSKSILQLRSLFNFQIKQQSFQLYVELLSSVNKIEKNKFHFLVNMFIQNKIGLMSFIKQFQCQDDQTKICIDSNKHIKKAPINLGYFRSLRVRLNEIDFPYIEYFNRSFMQTELCCKDFRYFSTVTIRMLKAFQHLFLSQKLCNRSKELYHLLVLEMWKVFVVSPIQSQPILKGFFMQIVLQNLSPDLMIEISKYLKINFKSQLKQIKDITLVQRLKRKKKQFQNKKSKNLKSLQNEIQVQMQIQTQNCCSICKLSNENEHLLFICNSQMTLFRKNSYLILKTCNHPVHRKCFQQALQGIKFKCPLCFFRAQFFLPTLNQQESFEIIRQSKFQLIDKYKLQNKFQQFIFFSAIFHLITVGLHRTQYFFRTSAPIYSIFLKLIKQPFELISTNSISQFQLLQANVRILMMNHLFKKQLNQIQIKNQLFLNAYIQNLIKALLLNDNIGQHLNLQCQSKAQEKILSLIKKPFICNNLEDLYKNNAGQCSNCFHKTDQILICLRCECFKTCVKCQAINIRKHVMKEHLNGTIIVKVNEGNLIYVGQNRNWVYPSMYEDYKNQKFKIRYPPLDRHLYNLNKKFLSIAWKHIQEQSIISEIRQEQSLHFKTFHEDI